MSLPALLLLRQLTPSVKKMRERMEDFIAQRIKKGETDLSTRVLGRYATNERLSKQLRAACVKQMGKTTMCAGLTKVYALLDDGSIVGWGNNALEDVGAAMAALPAEARYVSISSCCSNFMGLLNDGTVVERPFSRGIATEIYMMNGSLRSMRGRCVAATCGTNHSLALCDDGRIVGGGTNLYGQLNVPTLRQGLTYVGVAAGLRTSFGLLRNGTVVGWGQNDCGQKLSFEATLPLGRRCVQVVASEDYSLMLLDNGKLVCAGGNVMMPQTAKMNQLIEEGLVLPLVAISAGVVHALGLQPNGQVVGWGSDKHGESSGAAEALARAGGQRFVEISAAWGISMGRTDNGAIVIWGRGRFVRERVVWPPEGRRFGGVRSVCERVEVD